MLLRMRTTRPVAAFLAICLLIPGIVSAQGQQIREITITGNEHITKEAILAVTNLTPGTAFSDKAVQDAKEAIQSMGYFDRVTVGTETVDGGLRVVFTVVENPVVKSINITGNTVITTEELLSLMRTQAGSVLNQSTLETDIDAIQKHYRGKGYIAHVTEEVGINSETGVLTIPIMEVRVESIRVTGNRKTKGYVVLREMELKPGDVFNADILARDIMRVYDLGIFDKEGAEGYRLEPGSDLGKVAIIIPVKELKTGEISLGVGYSSRQGLVGQGKVSENNFRGTGQAISVLGEVGGSQGGNSYELSFFEPWLDRKHTSLGVNIYSKFIFRFASSALGGDSGSDYDERHKGGSVTLSRPFNRDSKGFVTLRSETIDTTIPANANPSLLLINQDGTVNSGTLRFTNDRRDSILDPATGLYTSYALELGNADFQTMGSTTSSNSTFAKYSVDLRGYFSRGGPKTDVTERRRVLASRLMAGTLTGNVPFFEQFFVGGAESLRGYREDRFWGKTMLLLSTEYRFPLAPSLLGVAFVDAGDAWGASPEYLNIQGLDGDLTQSSGFSLQVGYGVGIRVATPIGPLRLDYGFGKEGSRAHFSIGHVF